MAWVSANTPADPGRAGPFSCPAALRHSARLRHSLQYRIEVPSEGVPNEPMETPGYLIPRNPAVAPEALDDAHQAVAPRAQGDKLAGRLRAFAPRASRNTSCPKLFAHGI